MNSTAIANVVNNIHNDSFFLSLSKIDKDDLLDNIHKGNFGAGWAGTTWHGNIQSCPKCKCMRVTTCCACGCGACYTCNHRFTCMPLYYMPS